jgi:hypothetical protein
VGFFGQGAGLHRVRPQLGTSISPLAFDGTEPNTEPPPQQSSGKQCE